jgi:hypothetical protein
MPHAWNTIARCRAPLIEGGRHFGGMDLNTPRYDTQPGEEMMTAYGLRREMNRETISSLQASNEEGAPLIWGVISRLPPSKC